jgi:tetratricopeptide (TPR) repeat protein
MNARTTPPQLARPAQRWIGFALGLVTLSVYLPVTSFQFVNYDDTDFVTGNPHVQAGLTAASFKWAWTSEVARNWHPITMFTHMLDCQLFGVQPWWPHLVNALLHAANVVLLFFLFQRMTGAVWRSATVAALFALHPLHVESVAWVAERKDVLSTLFWFLTTWAYVRYVQEFKAQGSKFKVYYVVSLFFFALGLMSKPMLVTVPFALLLLDYWPLGRTKDGGTVLRLAVEKIPFFALSAVLCVVTFLIQRQGGAMQRLQDFPLGSRLANALVSYVRYIGKMFWPRHLAGLYLRSGEWAWWVVALASALLLTISVVVLAQGRRRPYLAVGWFWYMGTLVPVIGLVQVGMQSMADRFTYVPMIGLFVMVVWGGWELAEAWNLTTYAAPAAILALAACAVLTFHQEFYWKNSETLFKRMIDATPNNFMARYNLGNLYAKENRTEEAISNFTAAIQEEPNYAEAHNNLGGIFLDEKRYDEALPHYRAAVRVHPEYLYYFNLANALADAASARHDSNGFGEAVRAFQQALQLNPASSEAHQNLGLTWQNQGRVSEAVAEFAEAARLDSNRVDTWTHLGFLCATTPNRMAEAEQAFRELTRLQPNNADAFGWVGNALAEQNKLADAVPFYLTALKLNPADAGNEFNLGLALSHLGKRDLAAEHYRNALRIKPNYPEAQLALRQLQIPAESPGGRSQ